MEESKFYNRRKFIKNVSVASMSIPLLSSFSILKKPRFKKITILHTNDMHSHIDPFPLNDGKYPGLGGMTRIATLIDNIKNKEEISPDAPGMLARHYAPSTRTFLVDNVATEVKKHQDKKIGVLVFKNSLNDTFLTEIILSKKGSMQEAASNLYDSLHELDHQNLDVIITEKFPNHGLGKSINDRLQRATFSL